MTSCPLPRLGGTLAFVLLVATGCSGDPGSDGGPEPGPTSSSAPTPSSTGPSASPSESSPPTASPSSTIPPNTGAVLRLAQSSIQVPKGYEVVTNNPRGLVASAYNPVLVSSIGLSEAPDVADGTLTLREQARIASRSGYLRNPKFQGLTTVAGQEAFYLAGPIDRVSRIDLFGFVYDGRYIIVDVQVPQQMPDKQRQAIVDATLASLTLT